MPSLIAGLCFLKAGTHFEQVRTKQEAQTEIAMTKASEAQIELRSDSI